MCPGVVNEGIVATTDTSFTVEGLEEGVHYNVTVEPTNLAGKGPGASVVVETGEESKCMASSNFLIPWKQLYR